MDKLSIQYSKLTIEQVNLIKGVGILLIVLHNFLHNLPPEFGQNEFYFSPSLVVNYSEWMWSSPEYFLTAFFSAWGHYGVELFIFVSAYGCTISYQKKSKSIDTFMVEQFNKVYVSFVICLAVYIVLGFLKQEVTSEPVIFWESIIWKLLLISNFIPGEEISPVGPWWFIPFIFQFYLIFPLLLRCFQRFGNTGLLGIALFGYLIEAAGVWSAINFSPLGHLPLICLAMFLSKKESISLPLWVSFLALVVFWIGHYNYYFWLVSDLAVVLIMFLPLKLLFNKSKVSTSYKLFTFMGGISLHLFLVNGFLRSPFKSIALMLDGWWGDIISALLSLIFSLAFALVLRWFETYIRGYVQNQWRRNRT